MALTDYDIPKGASFRIYNFDDEEWMSEGKCYNTWPAVDMISIGRGHSAADTIKEYCDNCPVQRECGEFALRYISSSYGVWGGVFLPQHQGRREAIVTLRAKCGIVEPDAA